MKTIATLNGVIFGIVCAIAIYLGLDPKKRQTWLLGLYGFLTFLLGSFVGTGNIYEAVTVATIATFAVIFSGIMTYWNRERARKWLKEHGEDEE